jgi:hypothetical protein
MKMLIRSWAMPVYAAATVGAIGFGLKKEIARDDNKMDCSYTILRSPADAICEKACVPKKVQAALKNKA